MKLFIAGMFNSIQPTYDFVPAKNEEEAVQKIGEKLNMPYLPMEAKEVKVEGFNIILEPIKEFEQKPVEEKPKIKGKSKKDT